MYMQKLLDHSTKLLVFCWQHNDQSVTAANLIRPRASHDAPGKAQSSIFNVQAINHVFA